MTRPPLNRPVENVLLDWMEDVVPSRAPGRLLEEAFARTMRAPQARTYPWDRLLRRALRIGRPERSGWYAGGVAAAVVLTLGAAMFALRPNQAGIGGFPSPTASVTPSASPGATPTPTPSSTLTPVSVEPEATIPVTGVIGLASDGQGVWLFTVEGKLERIDPMTNAIAASVTLSSPSSAYQGLAVGKDGLWLTNWDSSLVERFDPASLKSAGSTAVGPNPKGVLVTESAVWVANTRGGSVSRIDPATNTVVATISVGPTGPSGPNWLAEGLGSIWVGVPNANAVVRIDEATNTVVATILAPPGTTPCGGVAVDRTAAWITSCDGGNLLARIDPATNLAVTSVNLGGRAYTVILVAGAPWLAPTSGNLVRVDPVTNAINRVIAPGPNAGQQGGDVIIAASSLWLVDGANNQIIRLPLSSFGG